MSARQFVSDFEAAFTDGKTFESDGNQYRIQVDRVGELTLPSGRIVAADPFRLDVCGREYYSCQVPLGTYPVDLSQRGPADSNGERKTAACLRIVFRNVPPVRWELATRDGEDASELKPFDALCFAVDGGQASFSDASALDWMESDPNLDRPTWIEDLNIEKIIPALEAHNGIANIIVDESTGANIVVCHSGGGDGCYPCYWGLDDHDEPVCLIADFGQLKRSVYAERVLGLLSDIEGNILRFELPAGKVEIEIRRKLFRRKMEIALRGCGARRCKIRLVYDDECLEFSGGQSSVGEDRVFIENWRFWRAIPDETSVILSYLDREESAFA